MSSVWVPNEFRKIQWIPLVIRYAAGVPSVQQNFEGEPVVLADVGTGEVTITLSSASLAPLFVNATVRSSAPNTAGANANTKGATTLTAVTLVVNADTDGATETDPVDVHVLIGKFVSA